MVSSVVVGEKTNQINVLPLSVHMVDPKYPVVLILSFIFLENLTLDDGRETDSAARRRATTQRDMVEIALRLP